MYVFNILSILYVINLKLGLQVNYYLKVMWIKNLWQWFMLNLWIDCQKNAWVFIAQFTSNFQWSLLLCPTFLVWMTLLILKSLRKNGINHVLMTLTQAKSSLEKTCPLLGSLTLGHKTGNVVYIEIVFTLLHLSLPILKKF